MQRDESPTMETGLERITEKARCEPKLRFTSLAHHIFEGWIGAMLRSVHRQGYRAPDIRRVYIPKPGKREKRPLGVPTVSDRALQRSTAEVLSAIYEQDFLSCSFGGRLGLGAHHALATLTEVIAGSKVGDPRLISLIRRWLTAGVLEDGVVTPSEMGTPQGGSISVLLSNVYLHYVLDLWFERVAKPRLRGEAYLVRYIDDFVVCFQYRDDALRLQDVLGKRLGKFGLALEPTKTKLVEFGRFAQRHASKHGRKRPETIYFLGFTLYCTRNRKGNFKVGMRRLIPFTQVRLNVVFGSRSASVRRGSRTLAGIVPLDDVPVARRFVACGQSQQCLERNMAVESPIVAKGELIEIGVDVLGA
jgi:RNA-directed DNA polymerase